MIMRMPKSIQVQTIDYCNRRCGFCPNSKMTKSPDTLMPMPVYWKIIEDLATVHYRGRLHLYLMAEPLCDPRITEFISIAKRFLPDNIIFISTNGDALKARDDVAKLFDAGLTIMGVSHYDDSTAHLMEYTEFPRMVHTPLKVLQKDFYNRGGNIDVSCTGKLVACNWLEQKAYINYRGDVILCCSDYHYKVVFGNVMDRPFREIYNCPEYNAYRVAHREHRGHEMPLCDKCNRVAHGDVDADLRVGLSCVA